MRTVRFCFCKCQSLSLDDVSLALSLTALPPSRRFTWTGGGHPDRLRRVAEPVHLRYHKSLFSVGGFSAPPISHPPIFPAFSPPRARRADCTTLLPLCRTVVLSIIQLICCLHRYIPPHRPNPGRYHAPEDGVRGGWYPIPCSRSPFFSTSSHKNPYPYPSPHS